MIYDSNRACPPCRLSYASRDPPAAAVPKTSTVSWEWKWKIHWPLGIQTRNNEDVYRDRWKWSNLLCQDPNNTEQVQTVLPRYYKHAIGIKHAKNEESHVDKILYIVFLHFDHPTAIYIYIYTHRFWENFMSYY